MSAIKTVLFDFDGTLMDTTNVIIQSWQEVYRKINGREGRVEDILATFGGILGETLSDAFPGEPEDKLVKIYRDFHHKHFLELIDLYPGVADMLAGLGQTDTKTALVTSRLKKTTMIAVEEFGLDRYFEVIVTADDCTRHKPDPQPLNIALERLGADTATSIMIGDTMYDRECARRAGMDCALVSWAPSLDVYGLNGEDAPEHIMAEANDLFAIIG